MDGVNTFSNSSRTSSEDEFNNNDMKSNKIFDVKLFLKNELDLLLKVFQYNKIFFEFLF